MPTSGLFTSVTELSLPATGTLWAPAVSYTHLQAVVMNSKPPFAITHAPGCMLITDTKNVDLKG